MKTLLLPLAVSIAIGLPSMAIAEGSHHSGHGAKPSQSDEYKHDHREQKNLSPTGKSSKGAESDLSDKKHDHREFKNLPPSPKPHNDNNGKKNHNH